ncbi:MAG: YciI family protein [Candidatus Nanopelagicaceae bacterium]
MPKYMVSFNDGDMEVADDEWTEVGIAAHAVMREANEAGVWIFGGGFLGYKPEVVKRDGSIESHPLAESTVHIGGFTVIEVPTKEDAYLWARKIGIACRCDQEVREIMEDEFQDSLIRRSGLRSND